VKRTKLESLSIFFPFYNDEGTVLEAIELAYEIGGKVANELEVIALHGGASKDRTWEKIVQAKKKWPDLVVVDKSDNTEGYAVIKYGFQKACKKWVCYTDGDLQYDLHDLEKLAVAQLKSGATVVNGYKEKRGDGAVRLWLGNAYATWARWLFQLPIRDVDCDFRLIQRKLFDQFSLESKDASILPELIVKLSRAEAQFAEVPVSHHDRTYGKSNYTLFGLLREKLVGDLRLWKRLK
jgi:glycosyltransferase involved in cell wall biosynthesis